MALNRYPRTARVRAGSDFDRIFKHGRRVALPVLALHWHSASAPGVRADEVGAAAPAAPAEASRLGLAVSRKVDPRAVGRNRIKRILRETFRLHRGRLAAGDYVVVARPGASRCSGDELRTAFLGLLKRAGALRAAEAPASQGSIELPVTPAPGTMPAVPPSTDPAS
ncbi:ribonuclease P protein component [Lysobacter olei]